MADKKKDKEPKIEIITDPAEIERLKNMESAHEQALKDYGREKRAERIMNKLADKFASGKVFNIVWHKIEALHKDSSALLRGHISESRDKHGKHFGLSVEVDYRKLYDMQQNGAPKNTSRLEFNQHRATMFQAGSFKSYEAAQSHMRQLDAYLMHVLAEAGAENTILKATDDGLYICKDAAAADQTYSDALRTARLVEAFRANVIDATDVSFRETVGILLYALTDELDLPFERKEKEELGKLRVRCIFDREVGEFTFTDHGRDRPATMKHEIPTVDRMKKLNFEGILTTEALQKHFIDWLAAAARERESISSRDFENLYGEIKAVKGVPLRTSKLGLLSPFPITGTSGPSNFRMN